MAERKGFLLRIDRSLWADLETWAAEELRSVNGQIEYVLKQALARRKGARQEPQGKANAKESQADSDHSPTPPAPAG